MKVKPEFDDHTTGTIRIALAAGTTAPEPPAGQTLPLTDWNGLIRAAKVFSNETGPGTFTLNAWLNDRDHLNPNAIQDIVVVCRYTVSNPV